MSLYKCFLLLLLFKENSGRPQQVSEVQISSLDLPYTQQGLKTLDTFGNCKKNSLLTCVSQYMHKITKPVKI